MGIGNYDKTLTKIFDEFVDYMEITRGLIGLKKYLYRWVGCPHRLVRHEIIKDLKKEWVIFWKGEQIKISKKQKQIQYSGSIICFHPEDDYFISEYYKQEDLR